MLKRLAILAAALVSTFLITPARTAGGERSPKAAALPSIAALTAPRPLARETVIVEEGQARAAILHPDSAAGRQAAAELARAVLERTGVRLECRPATAEDRQPHQTVFLLGNVDNNPALLVLYGRWLTLADGLCPGPGGSLVHTLFDPVGQAADVIVVAASDDAGLQAAAQVAAETVRARPAGTSLALPRLFLAQYSAEFLKSNPTAGQRAKATCVEEGLQEAHKALDEGRHCSVAAVLREVGRRYLLTGDSSEARLYAALWDLYAQSAVADPRKYGGPWGFDSDFPSAEVVAAWPVIEHDPALSDAERLAVTQHMARWLSEAVIPKCAGAAKSSKVLFNHQTFPALGALFAGLYFSQAYHVAEGRDWLAMADAIFRRQAGYSKPYEDCNTYQWLTNGHLLRYVVARPDMTVVENGNARKLIDYCLLTMDNLGYQVPYGDTGSWKCIGSDLFCLSSFAFLTKDPDALWAIAFKQQVKQRWSIHWLGEFPPSAAGVKPERFDGVTAWPVDRQYYATFPAAEAPPLEKCVDKISFREALDPQAAYLLVDGLSNGGHGHRDGNSLLQLTQYDRIWLADNDYFKTAVKYHNSLLVFRDGESGRIPDYCELLGAGQSERYGYSRTRLAGYSGVDWDRTVVWLKAQKAFMVLDRVVAREKGRYQLRVLWHGIGQAELSGGGLLLTQKGPSLRIQTAPGPAVTLYDDAELGAGNWDGYPYAEPVVRSLSAAASVDLEAGEPYLMASVLHGNASGPAARWSLRPVAGDAGLIVHTDDGSDVGIVLGPIESWPAGSPLRTDAQVIVSDAAGLTLLGSSRAALGKKNLQSADRPACTDLPRPGEDLAPTRLPAGTMRLALPPGVTPGPHAVEWEQALALHVTRLAAGHLAPGAAPPAILVATREGTLLALKPDGSRLWSAEFDTPLNDVTAADLDRDGRDEVIVARQDHYVCVLDADGHQRWKRELQYYRKPPYVNLVRTGDLDGDGLPEVIAGGENWRFYAYRADGTPLWNYESVHPSRSCVVADLDGDGRAEVVCGTHYYYLTAVSGTGDKLWSYNHGPIAYDLASGSFDGDKRRGVVLGSGDGCVHYLGPDGKPRMVFNTGDEVRHVLAADVDGDGRDEIFAGSLSHYVYCFGPDGRRRWAVDLGAGISALASAADAAGRRCIVAATAAGRVVTLDGQGTLRANSLLPAAVVGLLADGSTILVATDDGRLRRLSVPGKD